MKTLNIALVAGALAFSGATHLAQAQPVVQLSAQLGTPVRPYYAPIQTRYSTRPVRYDTRVYYTPYGDTAYYTEPQIAYYPPVETAIVYTNTGYNTPYRYYEQAYPDRREYRHGSRHNEHHMHRH